MPTRSDVFFLIIGTYGQDQGNFHSQRLEAKLTDIQVGTNLENRPVGKVNEFIIIVSCRTKSTHVHMGPFIFWLGCIRL